VRGFLERELTPHAQAWEEQEWFPNEVFATMARQGLLGLKYPTEYGGQGGDYLHESVLCEEMARIGSGGTAAGIGAHINIATPPIWKFGTDEQKQRYLAPAIRGEKIGALGITEPGAGSDVASLRTHAQRADGGWLLNGEKTYITNGVRADFIVTAVRTTPEGGHRGISFLIVERGQGVSSAALHKLGWHASDTATIAFEDVFVPEENLLGPLHEGFKLIMANFQWERLAMALGAVGAMQLAWERTAAFARERHAFGRALSGHQAIRHKLADLATSVYTCRCVTYDALRRFVSGEEPVSEVTMAKLLTQRASFELMDACLQIHGGAGYMREYWVERAARDARLGPIGGGSDEIMREILGRTLSL
jgi:acyl-CoA dehydrogenase